jgi:DNA-binding response OmpR family regulator
MNTKILVVEDEVVIAMQIKSILEEEGYEVVINIYSVEAAIQHIEAETPMLVLIDINLNKYKDGVDLGRYLLERGNIPYIYITSYSSKTTLDRVNETRPHGYIVKPFKPSDLVSTISIVLNNYKHREIDQ